MRNIFLIIILLFLSLTAGAQESLDTTIVEVAEPAAIDTVIATDDIPVDTILMNRLEKEMNTDTLVEPTQLSLYEPHHGMDFTFFKNTTNPNVKPYTFMQDQTWMGIPIFLAGLIAKNEKKAFRQDYNNPNSKIRLVTNFHSEVDNYTQFSGIALTVGLKLAGVEGRSSWPRLFASSVASYAVMAGFVNGIKYTAKEMRPDGSTRNSWPSGHTATAFVGATILHKEYGMTRSPWYSIAGYTVATATGVMRVLNNRHWISDVLSGAGIGILSTELAYGICDLLFKERGLLRNDLSTRPDLRKNPSFFSVSMGIGLGNKNLVLPAFDFYGLGAENDGQPVKLEFGPATAVGAEGAWFFNRYIGIGGRLRVKATPIKGWASFAQKQEADMKEMMSDSDIADAITYVGLTIESDHITEFAADLGVYFNLPLSSRFAIGTKLLAGNSVMDDVDVSGTFLGYKVISEHFSFVKTDDLVYHEWDYINLNASNSAKFGTGLSLTYAYKNSVSWRAFVDYDYSTKTYTASYAPMEFLKTFGPDILKQFEGQEWNPANTFTSSTRKHLHQWVLGGALCISF